MLTRVADDAGLLPGFTTNAFLILDKNRRPIARGAAPTRVTRGWCKVRAARYLHDRDLIAKCEQLAEMPVTGVRPM